jgi:hypothetical protein
MAMHRNKILIATLAITTLLSTLARADEPSSGDKKAESTTLKFTLRAAKPPHAALKYHLLPRYIDQMPGNAAPHYMRAALAWENEKAFQDAKDKIGDWDELPLAELNKNSEANAFFNSRPTGHWDLIRLAARRENCEWDLPLRQNHFSTHIPELQKMRDLGRLIAFKARMEMARGQFDQAIDSLQTGFAIAQHAGQAPTLINGMVGIAIAGIMARRVEELIQQPDCPNLYWTLSELPQPLVDLRRGLEMEQDSIYLAFPELLEVRTAKRRSAEWDAALMSFSNRLMTLIPEVTGGPDAKKDIGWWTTAAYFAVTAYPKAKTQLLDAGYSQAQIDAMPPSQAILLAIVETYDKQRDEVHKWYYVPTFQASARAIDDSIKKIDNSAEIVPLAKLLLPAINSVIVTDVCLRREIAATRVVEGVRLYAADHDNKLPQSLADIIEVPLPSDPVTGASFEYSVIGNTAVLKSPAPLNKPERDLRWELEMAAAK